MPQQPSRTFPLQSDQHHYSRLYQVILKRRTSHFCAISYLISFFVLWLTMLDGLPALWNGFHLTMWLMSGAIWASATIPLMTLRRIQLTAPSLHAPNRYTRFWVVLWSTEFITSTFFCLISSTLLCVSYILTASVLNENPDLSFVKKITGRGVSQINERPIYLLVSCWYTAFCYSFLAVYHGRWQYHLLDVSDHLTIPHRIFLSFGSRITLIRKSVISFSITYIPIYLALRSYLIRAIIFSKYTQLTKHIKPHMIMLIKYESILTVTSSIRLVMLNTLILTMWETIQVLWDVYSTHPLDLSRFDTEPNQCLLEGIKSTDPRIKHHAMRELAHVSWSDPARRATIFKDIRTSPKLLNLIIDECLFLIQTIKSTIESKGQSLETSLAPCSAQNSLGPRKPSPGAHSALKHDLPQLFQSPSSSSNSLKHMLLTKLLATDQNNPSPSPNQSHPATPVIPDQSVEYKIPQIFQGDQTQKPLTSSKRATHTDPSTTKSSTSVPSMQISSPSGKKREKTVPRIWKFLLNCQIFKYANVGNRVEDWLFSPLIYDEFQKNLPNRQLIMFAVEVVTNFSCASLTEDQYGVLQSQIPLIMETLVDSYEALDQFRTVVSTEFALSPSPLQTDSSSGPSDPLNPQQASFHQALDEFVHPLLTRLKTGIFGTIDQFKPFLNEMKLSPKIDQWIKAHPR